MFYVIDRSNRCAYADQLDEMFRLRHRIYVERRKWKALARADKREIDQFDTEDAVYLLAINEIGQVTAGLRLLPTTGPHLIRDVFPHAVEWGPVPAGERIYEFTRYFVIRTQEGQKTRRQAAGELLCAMFEYGLGIGLTHISLLCDSFFLPLMLECGWNVRPLGLPLAYPEGECIAVLFEVSQAAIDGTRKARDIARKSFLVSQPWPVARPAMAPALVA